ncbi:MAG: glycosyltransferase family 2 protein [Candidatus Rokubacteria bacterium]|nr:glycosyltransferase family 2 protein [Candidatus Rokubacteria bacterium]
MIGVDSVQRGAPERMDLSVVVCTYNRAELLAETLDALLRQVVPAELHWEILVMDNNSRDRTREVVGRFERVGAVPVRYMFEGRQGLCHARNSGVKHSRGAIVAFTDDDVRPAGDWAHGVILAMREHAADGVGGRVLPRWALPPPEWLLGNTGLLGLLALLESEECSRIERGKGARILGANMAFRRDLFDAVGGFNTSLGRIGTKLSGGEDTEFVSRAVEAGKVLVYDPRLVVSHYVGPYRMRKSYFRKWRFDAAENEGMQPSDICAPRVLGIPLYVFRLLAKQLALWLKALATRDPGAFQRELAIVDSIGFLVGCARNRVRSRREGGMNGPSG